MGGYNKQHGFSLIGLLVTVAIVGVLMVMSLQTYQPVMQSFTPGEGNSSSFGASMARMHMNNLHRAEIMYYNIHRTYATWDQLVADTLIQQGYTNRALGQGTPYIENYDIDIQLIDTGYIITARPNFSAGAVEGSPTYTIDQDGNLEEAP